MSSHLVEFTFKDFITRMQTLYCFDMVFRKTEIKLPRELKICLHTSKLDLRGRRLVMFPCTELTNVLTNSAWHTNHFHALLVTEVVSVFIVDTVNIKSLWQK